MYAFNPKCHENHTFGIKHIFLRGATRFPHTLENQSLRVTPAILNMACGYADVQSFLRTRFITLCVLYTFVALKHAASAAPRLDTRPHIPCGIIALHPTIDRSSASPFALHHSTLLERRAGETGAGEQERKDPSRCRTETKPT